MHRPRAVASNATELWTVRRGGPCSRGLIVDAAIYRSSVVESSRKHVSRGYGCRHHAVCARGERPCVAARYVSRRTATIVGAAEARSTRSCLGAARLRKSAARGLRASTARPSTEGRAIWDVCKLIVVCVCLVCMTCCIRIHTVNTHLYRVFSFYLIVLRIRYWRNQEGL